MYSSSKKLALAAAFAALLVFASSTSAYAAATDRNITLSLEDRVYSFSISTYNYEQSTTIFVTEGLLQDIRNSFSTTQFVFFHTTSKFESGGSFILIEPDVAVGSKLEVRFMKGAGDVPEPVIKPKGQRIASIDLFDISTVPEVVVPGETFMIRASVLNSGAGTVYYSGVCTSPITADFSSNITDEPNVVCEAFRAVPLKPNELAIVEGDLAETWTPLSLGVGVVDVTFTYWVGDPSAGRIEKVTEQFSFEIAHPREAALKRFRVFHENTSFDVTASLTNGSVDRMVVDPDSTSIVIGVQTSPTDAGELTIILPRELIDSRAQSSDEPFIVLVNGGTIDHNERRNSSTERELVIPIPAGSDVVAVVGTQVIPEFPAVVVFVVMGTLVAVAVAVGRFRNPARVMR